MKRVFTVIAILVLVSCKLPWGNYSIDLSEVNVTTIEEASMWVFSNVAYVLDSTTSSDTWQIPPETWELRTGDCEDFTILAMYICNIKFGIKPEFIIISFTDGSAHALFRYSGIYYDPTAGLIFNTEAALIAYYKARGYIHDGTYVFSYDKTLYDAEHIRSIMHN